MKVNQNLYWLSSAIKYTGKVTNYRSSCCFISFNRITYTYDIGKWKVGECNRGIITNLSVTYHFIGMKIPIGIYVRQLEALEIILHYKVRTTWHSKTRLLRSFRDMWIDFVIFVIRYIHFTNSWSIYSEFIVNEFFYPNTGSFPI